MLCSLVWLTLVKLFWRWKVYRQTDGWTNDGWQSIRKAHLGFQLRWAKKLFNITALYLITELSIIDRIKTCSLIHLLQNTILDWQWAELFLTLLTSRRTEPILNCCRCSLMIRASMATTDVYSRPQWSLSRSKFTRSLSTPC